MADSPALAVGLAVGLAVLLTAGCLATPQPAAVDPRELPRPELIAPTFTAPARLGTVGAAEPNVVVGPGLEVYVTTPLHLWRSLDGGRTFEELGQDTTCALVCVPGRSTRDPGLDGGGDGDLAGDAAGHLYWAGLFGDAGPLPFQVSRDQGATWSEAVTVAAKDNSTDREWIDARPDGRVYVTWRDFGASGDGAARAQLLFRASPDGGATWDPIRVITDDLLVGRVVHDPGASAVYVPYYDADQGVVVARSADEGRTWTLVPVGSPVAAPSQGSNGGSHIFPVAAVDDAGTVYVVWSVDPPAAPPVNEVTFPVVQLAASKDGGATWSAPRQLSGPGHTAIFPWIAAGAPGRVAVAWYENRLGLPGDVAPDAWDVVLVESVTADLAEPRFAGGAVTPEPVHLGILGTEGPYRSADRSLLDFFELAIRADGQPVLAWTSDAQLPRLSVDVHAAAVERGTPLR